MKRYLIVLVLCVGMMFSCGGNKTTGGQEDVSTDSIDTTLVNDSADVSAMETPLPKAADELFDDFFFNFVANRSLQLSRIHFPLPEWRDGKAVMKQKSEWKMDRFFMNQGY